MTAAAAPSDIYDRVIAEVERPLIRLTLAATRGNQIKAAAMLGLNRNTLAQEDPRPRNPGGAGADVNQQPPRAALIPTAPPPDPAPEPVTTETLRSWPTRLADLLLGRAVTIGLVVLAVATGIATFVLLARGSPFAVQPGIGVSLVWPICRCCCCWASCSPDG